MTKTTIKSKEEFLKAAEKKGLAVSDYAKSMMNSMTFEDSEVEYVAKTVRELGFTENPTFSKFLKELPSKGYGLLSPSQALAVGLDAKLEKYQWIRCAMETIPDQDGRPDVFDVVHDDGGQWLNGYGCAADNELGLDDLWFVSIRKDSLSLDPSPESLSSLTLERAIQLCKENGLTVTKTY